MSHFPSIPNLELLGLFRKFPDRGILPLLEYHDAILREDSELSVGERELIAAYVSALNDCHYCFSAHRDHAKAWGIPAEIFGKVQIDLDHPDFPKRMRPVLAFVRRLTVDPPGIGMADAQAVYDAGFSEEGLFDVISVTALYNFRAPRFLTIFVAAQRCVWLEAGGRQSVGGLAPRDGHGATPVTPGFPALWPDLLAGLPGVHAGHGFMRRNWTRRRML